VVNPSINPSVSPEYFDHMTANKAPAKVRLQEEINFLLSNRIPRQLANRLIGWLSHIESPLLARVAIAVWRQFADLDFSESTAQHFTSLHACFTRQLDPGARPINPDPTIIASPCDAIVGACGAIEHTRLLQAKGFDYTLQELLRDPQLVELYRDGQYATLRLTSSMYHRFHAPYDCRVERVAHIPGDTWNVNPIALKRVDKLFCKNERAIIPLIFPGSETVITLVPVGEMGWFEHGSTILVFAPPGVELCGSVQQGTVIRMGSALMRLC
jgi:phosphatidylserine decarboxylase